jgi:hypothetical protein
VQSRSVRVGDASRKGYTIEDLWGPWSRYLDPPIVPPGEGSQGSQPELYQDHVTLVTPNGRERTGLQSDPSHSNGKCTTCGYRLDQWLITQGATTHPSCSDQ